MFNMSEITIVIVTLNSKQCIASCLDSIYAQDFKGFQVIAIDNASKDGTAKFLKENYPKVILIENQENLGACKARNQGIGISGSKWVLTLDCDIVLEKHFLTRLFEAISDVPSNIGMIQAKILNADKTSIYSVGILLSFLRRFFDIGRNKIDNDTFNDSKEIFGACSAASCFRREMLEQLKDSAGYFDERFFFLVEDVELSWRAQKNGWKAIYIPSLICYHQGNSSGSSRRVRQYLSLRNRLLMISKHEDLLGKIRLAPFFLLYDMPRLLYIALHYKSVQGIRNDLKKIGNKFV